MSHHTIMSHIGKANLVSPVAPFLAPVADVSSSVIEINTSQVIRIVVPRGGGKRNRNNVTPTVVGLPAHVTADFVPAVLTPTDAYVDMTLSVGASAAAITDDAYYVEFTGIGVQPARVNMLLSITTPLPPESFSATVSRSTVSIQQGTAEDITVTLARAGALSTDVFVEILNLGANMTPTYPNGQTFSGLDTTKIVRVTADSNANLTTRTATVRCTCVGQPTQDITVSYLLASSGSNPTIAGASRIILNCAAGGAHDIQTATSWATFHAKVKSAGGTQWQQPLEPRAADAGKGDNAYGYNFVTDFDGAGTHALRSCFPGWGDRAQSGYSKDVPGPDSPTSSTFDGGKTMNFYLPLPLPTEMYLSWKSWHGRTAAGGGFDDNVQVNGVDRSSVVGRFAHSNEEVGTGRAGGRKWLLITRGSVGNGGCGRYDIIWYDSIPNDIAGSGTVAISGTTATFSQTQTGLAGMLIRVPTANHQLAEVISGSGTTWTVAPYREPTALPTITASAFIITPKRNLRMYTNNNVSPCIAPGYPMPAVMNVRDQNLNNTAFRLIEQINTVLHYTCRVKAASSPTAADGITQVWCNGELIMNATDINYGSQPFQVVQFMGTTFRTPRFTQTEYYWDQQIWVP